MPFLGWKDICLYIPQRKSLNNCGKKENSTDGKTHKQYTCLFYIKWEIRRGKTDNNYWSVWKVVQDLEDSLLLEQ